MGKGSDTMQSQFDLFKMLVYPDASQVPAICPPFLGLSLKNSLLDQKRLLKIWNLNRQYIYAQSSIKKFILQSIKHLFIILVSVDVKAFEALKFFEVMGV
ncbi:hypothetical protein CIPAW_08G088000 [Carya illinoinensis]|uniref:Uncharacterized protein n=1 Tax=Carya illinoinensis TaxID=32201 RepID=A0A8T1PKL9_CARIL|nr:hypothetical protein CIPAW_08G088000 [Carya illinoinensis]